jgi:hypothetical protein
MDVKDCRNYKIARWMLYDSETTIDVSESLGNFNIPVMTPAATSHILDDKTMFKTFFRTIPSDGKVTKAMAQLILVEESAMYSIKVSIEPPVTNSYEDAMHIP